jgi:hypothetical protein
MLRIIRTKYLGPTDTIEMIRPLHPCSPTCPGYVASKACKACWYGEVLSPTDSYYQRQPSCATIPPKET